VEITCTTATLIFFLFCCPCAKDVALRASFVDDVVRDVLIFTARSELRKVLFLAPSVCGVLSVYEISSREPLNGFATNSHGRRDGWSRARTTLKVKVNFGYLRAVYV